MQKNQFVHLSPVEAPATISTGSQTNAVKPSTSGIVTGKEALVYCVEDVARMLSISLRAAYNLCNTTTAFRVLHIGTSIRVNKASFDAWFTSAAD